MATLVFLWAIVHYEWYMSIAGSQNSFEGEGAPVILTRAELEAQPISHEIIHGHYETVLRPATSYLPLSQVRAEKNVVSEELKSSIETTGLMNQIDVARMDRGALIEYVSFVNKVWGSQSHVDDFDGFIQEDGFYYLAIAGHSRHEAILSLEKEGRIKRHLLEAKVHEVTSPHEIIELQLAENVHSQPPRERRAIAIVETYEWGLHNGDWANQKEYLEKHGSVGKSVLSEALAFANMPLEVRSFVLTGHMTYNAGIELGKAAGDLRQHILFKMNTTAEKLTKMQKKKIAELLLKGLVVETNAIINAKLNSTAAEKRIRAWRERMRRDMIVDEAQKQASDEASLFELDLKSGDMILDEELARTRAEITRIVKEYSRRPAEYSADMLQLNQAFVPPEEYEEALKDLAQASARARSMLGAVSTSSAMLAIKE